MKLAWLYRYKEDHENERKFLLLAQQRFLAAYEEEKYEDPQKDIYLMYMIGQTHFYTGDTAEALKWLSRVIQHPQKDHAPQVLDKAREMWQEYRQGQKRKGV
jgi:uncharacterized protein (DUF2225 family)